MRLSSKRTSGSGYNKERKKTVMVNFGCDKCVILPAGDTFLFYFGFVYDF